MSNNILPEFEELVNEIQSDSIKRNLVITTILNYGGSFFKDLALALIHADPNNVGRLCHAFPEVLLNYGPGTEMYAAIEKDITNRALGRP